MQYKHCIKKKICVLFHSIYYSIYLLSNVFKNTASFTFFIFPSQNSQNSNLSLEYNWKWAETHIMK